MTLGLVLLLALFPQDDPPPQTQKELIQLRDEKLAAEFLKKAPWFTDYDRAMEAARRSGKLVFAYFTRTFIP